MSPLCIHILLHYYARTNDYAAWAFDHEPKHAMSCAVREAMEAFSENGLIQSRFGDLSWSIGQASTDRSDGAIFTITDKGRAMVEALMAVQIPVCKWVQPEMAA